MSTKCYCHDLCTAEILERIRILLEYVIDKEKGTLRMVDVDRAKVYSTHLGKKLKGAREGG